MTLPPLGNGKQLWLRDGRAVIPQPAELLRLLELDDTVHRDLEALTGKYERTKQLLMATLEVKLRYESVIKQLMQAKQYRSLVR